MTLRLRLVVALFALMLVGLGAFGVVTYSLYARSQYQRLDDQIRAAVPFATRQLTEQDQRSREPTGSGSPTTTSPTTTRPTTTGPTTRGSNVVATSTTAARSLGGAPPVVPLSTFSELRDANGRVVVTAQLSGTTAKPNLPVRIAPAPPSRFFTVGSSEGSGQWRVYVTVASGPDENGGGARRSVVVAVPMSDVSGALRRLVLIEVSGGAGLLVILCGGAWLIMRRGLRPIEAMAGTAGAIAAGDLTQRVAATDAASEVGRLGVALNTMLDEIEEAFAQRDATEQRLRQFLADVSHELRTPLTSIQGFAELFRVGDPERVDLPTILRRIEQESARMKLLVDDLLLLARLDQTRPTEPQSVDLAVLAADACSDAAASAPDRPISLDAPEPVAVVGDDALLRQAIGNLIANAVHHTPERSPIEVTARRVDGRAVLSVRDHGRGLDADGLAHAFDRFWQADKARVGAGAGLGLAIVASVAHEHGGTVSVANASDGGAVFTFSVPAA